MKHLLTLILLSCMFVANAQERLIISEQKLDSGKIRRISIIQRNDLNGFEKINETTYKMVGINDTCNNTNPISIDGVQTFDSMPCFRDYIIKKSQTDNKIVTWGKLEMEEIETFSMIHNWETDKVKYVGNWKGAMANGFPGDGCGCSYSRGIGDYFEIVFYGTGISFFGEKNSHLNTADIYLDNNFIKEINEYANIVQNNNQIEFMNVSNLQQGTHVLKVVVTGKDTLSTSTGFVFHNVEIRNDFEPINNSDTVFIEKEIIVHDTVYVDKPVEIIVNDTIFVDKEIIIKDTVFVDKEIILLDTIYIDKPVEVIVKDTVYVNEFDVPEGFFIDGYILKKEEEY